MNISREDYLKVIYSSNMLNRKLTNKDIAEQLKISPPSVTEMISKLIQSKIVVKDTTLGYKLEKEGIREAQNIIRKHRLWEVFLVNYLGYDWQEVHEDAEILEHATSDLLSERLNSFLEYPQTCPHGSVIYGNVENMTVKVKLDHLAVGELGIICEVCDDAVFLDYLNRKNLRIGKEIQILFIDPFDNSIELKLNNDTNDSVTISYNAASKILVEINQ